MIGGVDTGLLPQRLPCRAWAGYISQQRLELRGEVVAREDTQRICGEPSADRGDEHRDAVDDRIFAPAVVIAAGDDSLQDVVPVAADDCRQRERRRAAYSAQRTERIEMSEPHALTLRS